MADANLRQRSALFAALADSTAQWSERDRYAMAALLDVLWSVATYERLVSDWEMDPDQATRAVTWAIDLITNAVRGDRVPRRRPNELTVTT